MVTKKITITLPEELVERVSKLASDEGLPFSTWLAHQTENSVRVQDGLAAMHEWEEQDGPPSQEAVDWVAKQFVQTGEQLYGSYGNAA